MSYARADLDAVGKLVSELDQLDQDVWRDDHLSGGQQWWSTILSQIRDCDYMVFALTEASINSKACRCELDYAHALGKRILPVLVGPPLPDQLLPPFLAETQRVDARMIGESQVTRDLARALFGVTDAAPLPDPLPAPPEIPISYLETLAKKVDAPELSLSEQRLVLAEVKQQQTDPEEREAATVLLRRMRNRADVYAAIASEIDTVLASTPGSGPSRARSEWPSAGTATAPPAAAAPPRQQPAQAWAPAPSSSPVPPPHTVSKKRRWPWIVALGIVTIMLLSVLSALGELTSENNGGSTPDPTNICFDNFGEPFAC